MTLWYLPLEPLDNRYTLQWYRWFRSVFRSNGVDFEYVDGMVKEYNLSNSCFLDMKSTFVWKFTQLARLFEKKIKDKDIIFIPDGEYPGIEAVEYFRKFYDLDLCVVEIWHAGTYDHADLTSLKGLGAVGKHLEEVWMAMADLIFVGSNYHKNIICRERLVNKDKIHVTGLPVDVHGIRKRFRSNDKTIDLVFTGRLSWEKGYDVVKKLRQHGYKILCTQELELSKKEYYSILGKAKAVLSPARQETFGYGVIEGMSLECDPVVSDGLSYVDYVPSEWRYNDEEEMIELIERAMQDEEDRQEMYKCVEKYQYQLVIERMLTKIEDKFYDYLY